MQRTGDKTISSAARRLAERKLADETEASFREQAKQAITAMGIPPFCNIGLELARTEKEIERCAKKAEKAAVKDELAAREAGAPSRPPRQKRKGPQHAPRRNLSDFHRAAPRGIRRSK